MRVCVLAATAGLLAGAGLAPGSTVSLQASKDNTLIEDPAGSLSDGAGPSLFVGMTNLNSRRRGLISFDVSSIPAGSTINSATLSLHMSRTITATELVELHLCTSSWGEGTSNSTTQGGGQGAPATPGDATWTNRFFGGATWTTLGGDFDSSVAASTGVTGAGSYAWTSATMRAQVQQWLNSPQTNLGWLIRGDESGPGSTKRFDTRENSVASNRPVLVIDYTPAPAPTVLTVLGVGAVASSRRSRRR